MQMIASVSLRAVVEEFVALPRDFVPYLDRRSGSILSFSDEDLSLVGVDEAILERLPPWRREIVEAARQVTCSEDWIRLPTGGRIDDRRIVTRFCESRPDARVRQQLVESLHGSRGRLGRFKAALRSLDIEQEWYDFESEEIAAFAAAWLDEHAIPYRTDVSAVEREDA